MKTLLRITLCALWLGAVAAGAWWMGSYGQTPGVAGQAPLRWPDDSQIPKAANRPTLLMFAHPQCPCTRASISELNRLLARCHGRIDTHIFFIQPAGFSEEWTHSASWKSAAAIPGVTVCADPGGQEALKFGAQSSGYVTLYDAGGTLLFDGGITSARGQAGDSAGANVIVSWANGKSASLRQTPVFGCGMFHTATLAKQ